MPAAEYLFRVEERVDSAGYGDPAASNDGCVHRQRGWVSLVVMNALWIPVTAIVGLL